MSCFFIIMDHLEDLLLVEKRQIALDDMRDVLTIERELHIAKEKDAPTDEIETRLREELTSCYVRYQTELEGTPERVYLNKLMIYYKVPFPEETMQKKFDLTIDEFCRKYKLATRVENIIMNRLYDSRRGQYHLGELLVYGEKEMGTGFGRESKKALREALAEEGLHLGMLESYTYRKGYMLTSSQKIA